MDPPPPPKASAPPPRANDKKRVVERFAWTAKEEQEMAALEAVGIYEPSAAGARWGGTSTTGRCGKLTNKAAAVSCLRARIFESVNLAFLWVGFSMVGIALDGIDRCCVRCACYFSSSCDGQDTYICAAFFYTSKYGMYYFVFLVCPSALIFFFSFFLWLCQAFLSVFCLVYIQ